MAQLNLLERQMQKGAEISLCRTYRYALWRTWQRQGHSNQVMFIGLNPSTADENEDDPTIRRCIRFAKDWGYSGLIMTNAFAFRATKPKTMLTALDPIGCRNDDALRRYTAKAELIVAAWGNHCPSEREKEVCSVINREIMCLGKTKAGKPRHPLYLRSDAALETF